MNDRKNERGKTEIKLIKKKRVNKEEPLEQSVIEKKRGNYLSNT